ncbi:GNAT family N-acetyltransferase [Marinobacter hydrocarbonoclasticus]|nr:GNAT family N-acetyltransferase [Marinobacter nauticus]
MTSLTLRIADYHNDEDCAVLAEVLDMYARDPMGGGTPLTAEVKSTLGPALAKVPGAVTLLAYSDNRPVGLINAFAGFSTFDCQPLLNLHDIVVAPDCRGQGVCQAMLEAIEGIARERGCAKMTLEVLEGNRVAQRAYERFGFAGYELDPTMGKALFWQKSLDKTAP